MTSLLDSNPQRTGYSGSNPPIAFGVRLVRRYIVSLYNSRRERAAFRDVHTYCMFIGHARSGHSIVGALLDAHPNVILADEVDALQYVAAGFSRDQIYHLLLARSKKQAQKGRTKAGREGKVYSYAVPHQWQGRFRKLEVIGDSKAGKSTQRLAQDLTLLPRLKTTMGNRAVKLFHVVRNPYDNISTMILRGGRSFENAMERYFANCRAIAAIREQVPAEDLFGIKQEDFLHQPESALRAMCEFLGVDAAPEYLDDCTSILYKSSAKSRNRVEWATQSIDAVEKRLQEFEFLHGYSWEA